jgi:hypothetical protein
VQSVHPDSGSFSAGSPLGPWHNICLSFTNMGLCVSGGFQESPSWLRPRVPFCPHLPPLMLSCFPKRGGREGGRRHAFACSPSGSQCYSPDSRKHLFSCLSERQAETPWSGAGQEIVLAEPGALFLRGKTSHPYPYWGLLPPP